MVHSLNAPTSQGCASLKLNAWVSMDILYTCCSQGLHEQEAGFRIGVSTQDVPFRDVAVPASCVIAEKNTHPTAVC